MFIYIIFPRDFIQLAIINSIELRTIATPLELKIIIPILLAWEEFNSSIITSEMPSLTAIMNLLAEPKVAVEHLLA